MWLVARAAPLKNYFRYDTFTFATCSICARWKRCRIVCGMRLSYTILLPPFAKRIALSTLLAIKAVFPSCRQQSPDHAGHARDDSHWPPSNSSDGALFAPSLRLSKLQLLTFALPRRLLCRANLSTTPRAFDLTDLTIFGAYPGPLLPRVASAQKQGTRATSVVHSMHGLSQLIVGVPVVFRSSCLNLTTADACFLSLPPTFASPHRHSRCFNLAAHIS